MEGCARFLTLIPVLLPPADHVRVWLSGSTSGGNADVRYKVARGHEIVEIRNTNLFG
jgi:hypothetical protein